MMPYELHLGTSQFVDEMQLYDIAVFQGIYGRNEDPSPINNPSAGDTTIAAFEKNGLERMFSIWDSDGFDTIDASGQLAAALIDLRSGHFSSISNTVAISLVSGSNSIQNVGQQNVSVAFGAYIERAVGTKFDDYIIGNILSNELLGGDGDDVIYAEGFDASHETGTVTRLPASSLREMWRVSLFRVAIRQDHRRRTWLRSRPPRVVGSSGWHRYCRRS
jgi:hypothetical protein